MTLSASFDWSPASNAQAKCLKNQIKIKLIVIRHYFSLFFDKFAESGRFLMNKGIFICFKAMDCRAFNTYLTMHYRKR